MSDLAVEEAFARARLDRRMLGRIVTLIRPVRRRLLLVILRAPAEVASYFAGFEPVAPGLVPLQQWLGGELPTTQLVLHGGIGRKPPQVPNTE